LKFFFGKTPQSADRQKLFMELEEFFFPHFCFLEFFFGVGGTEKFTRKLFS
jgi:hypothetical protein